MKILNVVWGAFPDIRLDKTGQHLGELGHQVDVLCLEAREGSWSWGEVIEAELPGSIPERAFKRAITVLRRNATEFPWRYLKAFQKIFDAGNYDVVQWNDLPGACEAALYVHAAGKKIILDMHENYADNMWSTERDAGEISFRYNMNEWLRYEKKALQKVDQVWVNIEEMAQRLIGMHHVNPVKVSVVRNAEDPMIWSENQASEDLKVRFQGKRVILFVGSCSPHRGLDVVIKSMPTVLQTISNAVLVIVGDGVGIPAWKELVEKLNLHGSVIFEGRKPFKTAQKYYDIAEIGVIPHQKYGQTDNGVPHKLAQNLINGLPVLVSSCHCLERVTLSENIGLSFQSGYPDSAAAKLLWLLMNPETAKQYGQNAKELATDGFFGWQSMHDNIAEAYGRI